MKMEYNIKNISGKNKALCIGDLIRYYGETQYKIIESAEKLSSSETTKGMVTNLLKKAMDDPRVGAVFDNIQELAKKKIFSFTIDNVDPIVFDNGKDSCNLIVNMCDEFFTAKAIYAMMRPGFRKQNFEDYVEKEKQEFRRWFEKNLKEYTNNYDCKILEE